MAASWRKRAWVGGGGAARVVRTPGTQPLSCRESKRAGPSSFQVQASLGQQSRLVTRERAPLHRCVFGSYLTSKTTSDCMMCSKRPVNHGCAFSVSAGQSRSTATGLALNYCCTCVISSHLA